MSKSAILSSSIVKKYWMALTGLFLCLFLVGHLLGNLQLIFITGEEGKVAFNEYAYFMTHNPAVKVLSYLTYFSILFHAIDGLMLTIQNKKARPTNYAMNKPNTNSSTPARYMAILGTVVLVFICTHMVNFWAKMHFTNMPLHTITKSIEAPVGQDPTTGQPVVKELEVDYVYTTNGQYQESKVSLAEINYSEEKYEIKKGTMLYDKTSGLKVAEGLKDLHSQVMTFFGQDIKGLPSNSNALLYVILYVLSMAVLGFHLWHGFSSAFQTLGLRSKKYVGAISMAGKLFAVIIPAAFAIIPILIYLA